VSVRSEATVSVTEDTLIYYPCTLFTVIYSQYSCVACVSCTVGLCQQLVSNCSSDNMCINRPTLGQSSVSPGRCQGPLISLCVHSLPSNIWASQLPSGHEKHSSLFGVVYLQGFFILGSSGWIEWRGTLQKAPL